jgi:hypothetical protein
MAKVTTNRAVQTSCKNTKVRTASGGCAPERKPMMKKGGSTKSFPDLNKDGKVTKADILIGKKVIPKAQKGAIVDSTKATSFQVHKKKQMPSFAAPSKEVKTLDSSWNPKNTYTKESEYKNPISKKEVGGATESCGPGKPKGCGYAKAQRKNSRSRAMSKVGPVVAKVLGTVATVGALGLGAMKGKKLLDKQALENKKSGGATHPGFKAVQSKIATKQGISKEAAGAILASSARKASAKAKAANPRLKKVK